MLVILMDNQILASQQVCQGCLLADQSGQPRWRGVPFVLWTFGSSLH